MHLNLFDRLVVHLDHVPFHNWRADAANFEAWAKWDRDQRLKHGIFGGLSFWSKTNVPRSRVLIARHWPHRLCWDWSIWVGLHRKGYDGKRKIALLVDQRSVTVEFIVGHIRFDRQNSQWMVASGPLRATAPRIVWSHHEL